MTRPEVKVRMAGSDDAAHLTRLVAFCGFEFEDWVIDFSNPHPHWLIAEITGIPVGCIQICYGRPIGRLEILGVDDALDHINRSRVVKGLVLNGIKVLYDYGAEAVSGIIPFEMRSYKRLLKKRGAKTLCSGNLLMARVR